MRPATAITKTTKTAIISAIVFLATALFAQADPAQSNRRHRVVLVSIPDRQLAVLENGVVLRTFPVSVGAAVSPSPVGEFQIINHVAHPSYSHNGKVMPPGPSNPLGPRWMGLSIKGYGIHGTNQPRSIGKASSHGCIRLTNRDVVELCAMLAVGDTVEIHAERDAQIARIFGSQEPGTEDHATLAQVHQPALAYQNHAR
jgi:lipoprotein-anchoring transpeptidase ErfK/SrfK